MHLKHKAFKNGSTEIIFILTCFIAAR